MEKGHPNRKTVRLRNFDYSGNATYFLTICTFGRRHLFGEILDNLMTLNEIGSLVEQEWLRSALIRCELDLHSFVVMPNHIHGLVTITPQGLSASTGNPVLGRRSPATSAQLLRAPRSLGSFVSGFKSSTTRKIR